MGRNRGRCLQGEGGIDGSVCREGTERDEVREREGIQGVDTAKGRG